MIRRYAPPRDAGRRTIGNGRAGTMVPLIALLVGIAAPDDPVIVVDLPRGPAGPGLRAIARSADQPLVARPQDLAGRTGPPLKGRMALSRALARWCGAARLDCRREAHGIVVRAAAVPPPQRLRLAAAPSGPGDVPVVADIVVTGRRGVTARPAQDRSYSATHIDADSFARRQPDSLAEVLATVPGLWVDPSAGTAANTVRVRGLPLDGYQALAVQEDGLPVQHDTLPWSDIDQFVRPDLMIDSADYVRGGPSAIFASNAPGGILNLRTRAPTAGGGGAARVTANDRGLLRLEGYRNAGIGRWSVIAGGGVSRDPGVRRIATTLGGWQARLRADRPIGSDGRLTLAVRLLDDDTLNVSSLPLRRIGTKVTPLPGFDPRQDSWFGPDLARVDFAALGVRPVARNNRNRLVAATATMVLPVGDWRVTWRGRQRMSRTNRYALSTSGVPQSARAVLDAAVPRLAATFPALAGVALRRTVDGSPFAALPGNDLVETINPVAADVRLRETIGEMTATRTVDLAGRHDLTFGGYGVAYRWRFARAVARALVEARGQGRLLDLVAIDGDGRTIGSLTDHGLLSRGSTYEAIDAWQRTAALFAADEWNLTPHLRLDTGLRHEWLTMNATIAQPVRIDGGDPATIADDALVVPSGQTRPARARVAGGSATAALHWRATPTIGLFARATRATRMPDPGLFRSADADPRRTTQVDQQELGLLWRTAGVSVDATLFASRFARIAIDTLVVHPHSGAIVPDRTGARARTIGVEIDAHWRVAPSIGIDLAATLQDPRLIDYRVDEQIDGTVVRTDLSGRTPRRVPYAMARIGLVGDVPGLPITLDLDATAMGRRYADDANTLPLPPFALIDIGARWRLRDELTLRLRATNLFDAIAVMQGDAIGGEVRAPAGEIFVGRAQQGRIVEAAINWRF
ncbi:hypothetical protein ASG37_03245 [Sphingomonas sp. Leaf407]|uniref:TonB-dependent receptor n=1 Tax=unclassified Sphingomonas TaxID=196159 RepID=UPI0006F306DC|nr:MULTISPECIES: TonB-dependent receptor [unclassified Sphingomonas]KQN40802.1 hypothetical protein ASE97_03270 [Sphingomonas sp. Leaf42]KQT30157.1 hypothetical protein ASG37_03245 [Sphingomonas sp. Leaf407]